MKNEPLFDVPDITPQEASKPVPPKNDITNKFWQLVEFYCQETTADDVKVVFLLSIVTNCYVSYYKLLMFYFYHR